MTSAILLFVLLQEEAPRPARVDLSAEGAVIVAGETVEWRDLAGALRRLRDRRVREVVIRADASVPFSRVHRLMAVANEAGIERVFVGSEEPEKTRRFAGRAEESLRVKIREGTRGTEVLLLRESAVESTKDLQARLEKLRRMPIVVDPDPEVGYDAVREVLEACREAGFSDVSFAGVATRSNAVRVLLAERLPQYEFRYLKNYLDRSKDFRVDVFLESADPDFPGVLHEFPSDLSPYDVVVLGSIGELDDARRRSLGDFVRNGGGIVWLGASEVLPDLRPVVLVRVGGGGIPLAALGFEVRDREHPLVLSTKWDELSGQAHSGWKATAREDATVLVEARWEKREDRTAFLVVRKIGKGRAVYVGAEDTWRWRVETGDEPRFGPFWTGVLRWAAGK